MNSCNKPLKWPINRVSYTQIYKPHLSRGGHLQKKNRFFYKRLTKKVLNRNSAPINKELIDFPKGEDKITSICFMISDGEVPPDVVPTAYSHSKSLNTHIHSPAPTAVYTDYLPATSSTRSLLICSNSLTAQQIRIVS